jgi:hypothetical protein
MQQHIENPKVKKLMAALNPAPVAVPEKTETVAKK